MRRFMKKDLKEINQWRELRKAPILSDDFYPPTGFFEPGVAAGFINFTETSVAFIENLITNPQAEKKKREQAILAILEKLERFAYDQNIKWIVAVTNHPQVEKYAFLIKGERIPGKLFGKEL